MEKLENLLLETHENNVALVGDEDLISLEMVSNLLIFRVWEP